MDADLPSTSEPRPPTVDVPQHGLLARVIAAAAANPWVTLLVAAALGLWGWHALRTTPLDAIPDLSDVQVIVYTDWPGKSPDLVEDQITYPISSALLSAPKVDVVRGQSAFGASFVYVIFEDGTDLYWARSRVLEYLASARAKLPPGVDPQIGPDATGVGWVYEYALVDDSHQLDLQQLRGIQDWNLRFALGSVPGVAEVAPIGGFVKEYEVAVDPEKLRALDVGFDEVVDAVQKANDENGGHVVEIAGHEQMIRGRGYVGDPKDLLRAPVHTTGVGQVVRVGDVGTVQLVPAERRGIAELNGEGEAVGGIVVMRQGENALAVIDAVKERLAEVEKGLPKGVRVVPTYDRSVLIDQSIETLRHTLIEEMIVVSVVIALFLMHLRSALIPVVTLPLAVLLAFVPFDQIGLTANIMSLGGIAVAIGAMVDASIILVENAHKRLEHWEHEGRPGPRSAVIVAAMQEVGPSIFFSLLVLTVSFLPVFTLQGTEGRLFRPLAYTKTFSMGFAAALAITVTPALAVLVLRGRMPKEDSNPVNWLLVRIYEPVARLAVTLRWLVIAGAVAAMALTIPAFLSLQSEFMPPLNEGTLLYMPTAPPGMGATEAGNVVQEMDREIKEVPEVRTVFGKMGRADSPTDPAPLGMAETIVTLAPQSEWRSGLTWSDLVAELDRKLRIPGMPNVWWMPIQTRTEMLATGVRTPLGIQVFGDDLTTIERAAVAIERAVKDVPGTRSAFAERAAGGYYLDVAVDRDRALRYGLSAKDVDDLVAMGIGGMPVSTTVEGRERYPIAVRFPRELRDDPDAIGRLPIMTPSGATVPLSEVATITPTTGPDMLRSEDGQLVSLVFVDPGDVPLAEYVRDAKAKVAALTLPSGVRVAWTGQFKYYERAAERLQVVVPVTLLLVFLLLYANRGSLVETLIVMLAVPFSLIGAVWLLWLLGYHLSVAVWVGLIALAGLDAETGMVMLLYLDLAYARHVAEGRMRDRADLAEAIVEGAARRIRPKAMTVLAALVGLLPVLWSTGTGADVMKRVAAPMVGGLVTSFLLELLVYPGIYAIWKGRSLPQPPLGTSARPSQAGE